MKLQNNNENQEEIDENEQNAIADGIPGAEQP